MANPVVASTASNALNYADMLQGEQNTAFQNSQTALNAISSAWSPILQSGQVPFGYSAGLNSMLQSQIINQGATATANAENAAQLQERQASGGAPGAAPTGASQAINAEIEAKGNQSTATNLENEQIAGYQQGLQNIEGATQAEEAVASGQNTTGLAGATTGAENAATTAGEAQWKENQASSVSGILGTTLGAIGGAASDIMGVGNVAALFNPNNNSNPSGSYSVNPTTSVSAAGFNPQTGVFEQQ